MVAGNDHFARTVVRRGCPHRSKGVDTMLGMRFADEGRFVWGFALACLCGLVLGSVIGTLLGHDSVTYLRRLTQRFLGRDEDVNFEIFVQ